VPRPLDRKASLAENGLAFRLDDRNCHDRARKSKPPTPDNLPWEGRQPPANPRLPLLTPLSRGAPAERCSFNRFLGSCLPS